eukprot:7843589-Lingulodinium_polyedra.AAC.1
MQSLRRRIMCVPLLFRFVRRGLVDRVSLPKRSRFEAGSGPGRRAVCARRPRCCNSRRSGARARGCS